MIQRTTRLLILIGASIGLLIAAYGAFLYSAAWRADLAQDRRTGVLVQGEITEQAEAVHRALEKLAISDAVFDAAARKDESQLRRLLCAPAAEGGSFVTIGLMSAGGEPIFLCEGGQVKIPAEHDYLFDAPRALVKEAFQPTLKAQETYKTIFPELVFRDTYLSLAERPYLLMAALAAPQQNRPMTSGYRPAALFGYWSMKASLTALEERLGVENLRLADPRSADVLAHRTVITSPTGNAEATVGWDVSMEFRQQLMRVLPMVLGLSLLVFCAIIIFLRRVNGLQRDLAQRESEMRHMALHDALTDLPNRAQFLRLARDAISASRETTAAYFGIFDLDRFKIVNDTYGHDAGDALIIETARRSAAAIGADNTVARLGGDEFALILRTPQTDEDALDLMHRLGIALRQEFACAGEVLLPSASIGLARVDRPDVPIDEVLKMADIALYQVKANGRGHCRLFKDRRANSAARRVQDGPSSAMG